MYEALLLNNHHILCLHGKHYLIDTGSPGCLSTGKEAFSLTIKSNTFRFEPIPNYDRKAARELIGIDIDGIIGLNALAAWGLVLRKDNTIILDYVPLPGEAVPFKPSYIGLMVDARIGGVKETMILDTGAKIGYGVKRLFRDLTPVRRERDYNPLLGSFESDIYVLDVRLGSRGRYVDLGYSPLVEESHLKHVRQPLIMGINEFFDEYAVFDFNRKILVLN